MSEVENNEETEAEETAAEEAAEPAEQPAAEGGDAAEADGDAEAAEELSPKQRRKLARATHTGEARPPRTIEERVAERLAERRRKAANRRRRRAKQRQARVPGTGTPPRERKPGTKMIRQGTVVSDKADKTITVQLEIVRRHPTYEKVVRRTATVHAHDERNEAHEGDRVRVIESRPLSRTKRWRLLEVVERAR